MKTKNVTVLCGGKFNAFHKGHEYFLKKCKSCGDKLVVVLAHDSRNKVPYAKPAEIRKKILEKTGIPDKIIIGSPENFSKTVEKIRPDVICLGYDQKLPKIKNQRAIKIIRIKKYGSYATSKIFSNQH
ncbi:MAG: adenylyltransferase/cytidyltransferase family protein [Candidatus Aenigmarchaeota archaeon]|nr:adenylyltransferase/cytidyltransferase family protein [Candidatus Aenigmarchaeota archaeon]